jgi:integrase
MGYARPRSQTWSGRRWNGVAVPLSTSVGPASAVNGPPRSVWNTKVPSVFRCNSRSMRIGERAGLPFLVHVHMLRHACGYAMANAGHDTRLIQDWLGHRAIQHTARYTELSPLRFKDVWRPSVVR